MLKELHELKVFTGNASKQFAQDICKHLCIPLGQAEVFKFKNDNTFVRILENIRERDVFLVQSCSAPVNDHIMELLIMIDTAKRASAGRITAVMPYYPYGRTDKKDQPRTPITAKLVADLLTAAGANRILTMGLHAGQIQGFFNIPVDELTALFILADYFKKKNLSNLVVVATDIGISKRARNMAKLLNVPLAIIEKRRIGNEDKTETLNVIGDVRGKIALLFDDEIDTGGSLVSAAKALKDAGTTEAYGCVTHGVLSGTASLKILSSPIKELIFTDTIFLPSEKKNEKLIQLSVASLFAETISRIHFGGSVGELFCQHDQEN